MTASRIARTVGTAVLVLGCAAPLAAQGGTAQPSAGGAQQPQGAPRQMASPRDSASATVAGASVLVDYSRPSKRGRQIFGGLVPYNQVWRTGANAATTLVTSRALRMGTTTVPAGTYTLYTIPAQSGWTLIINRQTGQWGTEYDKSQDLARVPMRVSRVATPAEQFTIEVRPQGAGGQGVLAMTWDTTRAEAPFTVVR